MCFKCNLYSTQKIYIRHLIIHFIVLWRCSLHHLLLCRNQKNGCRRSEHRAGNNVKNLNNCWEKESATDLFSFFSFVCSKCKCHIYSHLRFWCENDWVSSSCSFSHMRSCTLHLHCYLYKYKPTVICFFIPPKHISKSFRSIVKIC